jgi:hypothetical protein
LFGIRPGQQILLHAGILFEQFRDMMFFKAHGWIVYV